MIPKIIPPTPNAAALEKFSATPVNYSTGIPSIEYPMWSWQRGRLNFGLGLAYHAGGHKVDDMASNVGLGWAMTGIGRVTRTVRGVPDDNIANGFIYTPILPQASTYLYDHLDWYYTSTFLSHQSTIPINTLITEHNSPYSDTIIKISENKFDGEQDIFSFSCNGASGRFVLDKDRNVVALEHTNTKITPLFNSTTPPWNGSSGKLIAFHITDDRGIVYKYNIAESQISTPISDAGVVPAPTATEVSSSWLLSTILDPITMDSIQINYSITGIGVEYETGFGQSESFEFEHVGVQGGITPGFSQTSNVYSYSSMSGDERSPVGVFFPDGSTLELEYNFSRVDYLNSKALTTVKVKNMHNELIKQYGLTYSYFSAHNSTIGGTDFHGIFTSANDYGKRLRLDRIEEISNDNTDIKPTIFTYNQIALNKRGSKNIDYWGYNVNPARNNLSYLARIPMDPNEIPILGQAFLGGSDRRPDGVYALAALLEKIQYPTGGHTRFEYEPNTAFSDKNYSTNELRTSTPDWVQSNFGLEYSLSFTGRTEQAVAFTFGTSEYNPRPIPDPNEPQTCFEQSQDLMLARFEIRSTDNTYTHIVEDYYSEFFSPAKQLILNLPLGKTYAVKFVYNSSESCAFIYPFKAFVYADYQITPQEKLAGGVRVKRIISSDGTVDAEVKEFNYELQTGVSSGTLTTIPNFGYYRTGVGYLFGCCDNYPLRNISRSSSPVNTLSYHNGSPLVYSRVVEMNLDGSKIERHFDPIVSISNGGYSERYPYIPSQDIPIMSGLLLKESLWRADGSKAQEKTITYDKNIVYLVNDPKNRNLKAGNVSNAVNYTAKYYVADQYFMYKSRVLVISEQTKTFENGDSLIQSRTYSYDPASFYLRSTTYTTSKGENHTETLNYISDESGAARDFMVSKHMVNYQTQKVTSKTGVVNGELFKNRSIYQLFQGGLLPNVSTVQTGLLQSALATEVTFNGYDNKGNITQYTAKDGVVHCFIWGYNSQYPVARIIGKSYAEAMSQSLVQSSVLKNPSSSAAMRTELDKLHGLANCVVETYVYKPLVGVISQKDPNGRQQFYEYDNFNRLTVVKDDNGHVLKKICYNYHGQPVSCGVGTLASWTAVSSICELNAQNLFTGKMIVTEQDMNPLSATFNQTRQITLLNPGQCPSSTLQTCTEEGKKILNGVCETGTKVCTSVVRVNQFSWKHFYHYVWSDSSVSPTYEAPGTGNCFEF